MKKHDLPAMPFYVGDWRKAPDIRALTLEERGLWFEMLCIMWECPRRGFLSIDGKSPISDEALGRMIGEHSFVITKIKQVLQQQNIFSIEQATGIVYNRRMVKDEEIRVSRSIAGELGMKNRYSKERICYNKTPNKHLTNTEDEDENENEKAIEDKNEDSTVLSSSIIKESKNLKFVKPSLSEVFEYCKERRNHIDPEAFMAFYESKGWRIGNSPMKSWKAAIVTWEKRSAQNGINQSNFTTIRNSAVRDIAPPGKYARFDRKPSREVQTGPN